MTEYTPLSRFRKFIGKVNDLAKTFGEQLNLRSVKTGGTTGQVPKKISGVDFAWTWQTLLKSDVGLGNVDNTSDLAKPISTATQTELDARVEKANNGSDFANASTTLANLGGVTYTAMMAANNSWEGLQAFVGGTTLNSQALYGPLSSFLYVGGASAAHKAALGLGATDSPTFAALTTDTVYADDAAAAIGGIAVGHIYRKTGGTVVWRTA